MGRVLKMVSRQSVTVVLCLKGNNNLGIRCGQRESSWSKGRNAKRVSAPQGEKRLLSCLGPEVFENA